MDSGLEQYSVSAHGPLATEGPQTLAQDSFTTLGFRL